MGSVAVFDDNGGVMEQFRVMGVTLLMMIRVIYGDNSSNYDVMKRLGVMSVTLASLTLASLTLVLL